jgi:4-diphosphocytidyl-2-C-methyl-D-erythritol kinase
MNVATHLSLRPPAKLNLFLHILGRRHDGLHLLQTAFELIDWCDDLQIELRQDGRIERVGGLPEVATESDLVVRAARALQALAAPGLGCTMTLTKRIPSGAGLGGGSSDAAAVLLALNRLWALGLDRATLTRIGVQLGADVPVFIGQQPAFAEGVGEVLRPLPFAARHYVVIFPGVALATGPMFAEPTLRRDCRAISVEQYLAGTPTDNVFEPVACAMAPEVARARAWLLARLGNAKLTGSGSALFAQVPSRQVASAALADLPVPWIGRAASSITNWFDNIGPGT